MKLTKYNLLKVISLEEDSKPYSFSQLASYFNNITTNDISTYLHQLKQKNYIKNDLPEPLQDNGIILHKYSLTVFGEEFMYEYQKNTKNYLWTAVAAIAAIFSALFAILK